MPKRVDRLAEDEKLAVCYVVAYRDPDYVRTRNIRAALERLSNCVLYDATNQRSGWTRYFETIAKVVRIRSRHNPDVYVLGFRGHEIFWIIRLIALGKRLVFDEFMSPSDALISEKKLGNFGKLLGYLAFPLERFCLRTSDHCITDTLMHKDFIEKRFSVAGDKIGVVYVGATIPESDSGTQDKEQPSSSQEKLSVLFYGTFLPLHGMDVLLRSCHMMKDKPIVFNIIGGKGKALADFRKMQDELQLSNVQHKTWVELDELQSVYIPGADLCLGGPFGGTPQARRVITGKTMQFLAQSKATIIGRTDEPVGLVDRENCLLVDQASPRHLAEALDWAIANKKRLPEIGRNGHKLFQQRFSVESLAKQLEPALRQSR